MKITIDIPKEFELDYKHDKFAEFFGRVYADVHRHIEDEGFGMTGLYELETLLMLKYAFTYSEVGDAIPVKWIEKWLEQFDGEENPRIYVEEFLLDDWRKENETE